MPEPIERELSMVCAAATQALEKVSPINDPSGRGADKSLSDIAKRHQAFKNLHRSCKVGLACGCKCHTDAGFPV